MSATYMNEGRFELYFDSRIGSFWNSRSMNVLQDAEDRQFAVQIFTDTARGLMKTWRALVVCRIFFIGWGSDPPRTSPRPPLCTVSFFLLQSAALAGLFLAAGFTFWSLKLLRVSPPQMRKTLREA